MKVYGPYRGKDNRYRVVLYVDGKTTTKSYPRHLLESNGITIKDTEDVHHIDGNTSNNSLSNLVVVAKTAHCSDHATKYTDSKTYECPICECSFELTPKQKGYFHRNKRSKNSHGPYCSKHCSGIHGANVQRIKNAGVAELV